MVNEKLDSIVCSALTDQGLPVHFYMKFLNFGIDCIRNLHMDIMRNVIREKLPVNSYYAIKVPCNFLDWVKVSIPVGQYIKNLSQKPNLNGLKNYDENGVAQPYQPVPTQYIGDFSTGERPYTYGGYYDILNDRGEVKGGVFGYGGGQFPYTFQYFKDRGEIQLDRDLGVDHVILEYISDGIDDCGCDTVVDPYAFQTIKTYMIWMYHLNNKRLMKLAAPWEVKYGSEVRKLRGRKTHLTKEDILRIMRKNYKATIKN